MLNKKTTLTTQPNRIVQFMVLSYVLDREKRDVCPQWNFIIFHYTHKVQTKTKSTASCYETEASVASKYESI